MVSGRSVVQQGLPLLGCFQLSFGHFVNTNLDLHNPSLFVLYFGSKQLTLPWTFLLKTEKWISFIKPDSGEIAQKSKVLQQSLKSVYVEENTQPKHREL